MSEEKHKLPAIQDLYGDIEMKVKYNDLNAFLNQPPADEWLKVHPVIKVESGELNEKGYPVLVPLKYVPIERVEWLLTRIFIRWRREILDYKLIANSLVVKVRLHYQLPISLEWDYEDGIGAVPIQTQKGAGAIDFNKMHSNAIQIGIPAAASYALKNACKKWKLFGGHIQRKDDLNYFGLHKTFSDSEKLELKKKLSREIEKCKDKKLAENVREEAKLEAEMGTDNPEFYEKLLTQLNPDYGKEG